MVIDGLVNKPDNKVTIEEVIAILGRFKFREDFYIGEGYSRKSCKNGLLTSELFYNSINFNIKDTKESLEVFTTRVDTICGVSFLAVSPNHNILDKIKCQIQGAEGM